MTEVEFGQVRKIRMILRDPSGVNDIIYSDSLPDEPDTQAGYYIADLGNYQKFNIRKQEWEKLSLLISDAFILETLQEKGERLTPVSLINFLIMGLQAGAISFSAGAQSVSKASLRDLIDFYKEQKKILEDQAGVNTGRTARTAQPIIGGVTEVF
jgi:hypothetical protein